MYKTVDDLTLPATCIVPSDTKKASWIGGSSFSTELLCKDVRSKQPLDY